MGRQATFSTLFALAIPGLGDARERQLPEHPALLEDTASGATVQVCALRDNGTAGWDGARTRIER